MGQYSVKVGGVGKELQRGSLTIDHRIEERSVAMFTIYDEAAASHYEQGEAILIYDQDAVLVFGGIVDRPEERRLGAGLQHSIRCIDYHYHADKLIAADSYTTDDCGTMIEDLRSDLLNAEGISAGTIQAGPTISALVINYVTVAKAFDAIAELAGFTWYIDENKALYFIDRATNAAPWAITSADMLKGKSRLQRGHRQYRNRQYIRGGKAATDPQTENRTADGETESFAMGYPLIQAPTVTEDAGGKTVGIKGIDTGKDYYWNKGDPIITAAVAPANGVALAFTYVGEFNIMAVSYDTDAVTARLAVEGVGTGYVDDMSEDHNANTLLAAFETATAKIERFAADGKKFRFETWRSGLKPGQLATVTYSPFGLAAAEMLIEAVRVRPKGDWLLYQVTAVEGPVSGSWAKFFGALSTGQIAVDKQTIGEETILIILVEPSDAIDLAGGAAITVWACPNVAVDLYPAVNLYPC